MKTWHYMTEEEVNNLVKESIDVACKHIQDVIGVEHRDLGKWYFKGSSIENFESVLWNYIIMELKIKNLESHQHLESK
jgi:hypothetical protein